MSDWRDELVSEVAQEVVRLLEQRNQIPTKKPLTIEEFSQALQGALSPRTVYRNVEAGLIKRVPRVSKTLIPHSELKNFQ